MPTILRQRHRLGKPDSGIPRSKPIRLCVASRTNPENGLLDVSVVQDGTVVDPIALGTRFALSNYLEHGQVILRQVKRLFNEADLKVRVSVDGNRLEEPPVEFQAVAQALKVVEATSTHLPIAHRFRFVFRPAGGKPSPKRGPVR